MFTGNGPVLETDILALLVTTVVFLSGFSSLRPHATLGNKRRVVDDVVSSVTPRQLSRANARSAVKHFRLAQSGRDGIELLNTQRCAEWPVTWQELGYLPVPLCDDPILVRPWWHDAADRLVSHDATDEFADLWAPT